MKDLWSIAAGEQDLRKHAATIGPSARYTRRSIALRADGWSSRPCSPARTSCGRPEMR
jgi:hypothetical protein